MEKEGKSVSKADNYFPAWGPVDSMEEKTLAPSSHLKHEN